MFALPGIQLAARILSPATLLRASLAVAWLALVGGGFWLLQGYSARPGPDGGSPARWPDASRLERSGTGYRLVLFAHPRCPCSRATLAELARLMAHAQGQLTADVLFCRPRRATPPWRETGLWAQAAAIPGVRVAWDDDGEEAARFGARTSGCVVVYDAAGRLRFRGGVTPARGHEGDSAGSSAILALLAGQPTGLATAPAFGCPLVSPDRSTEEDRP